MTIDLGQAYEQHSQAIRSWLLSRCHDEDIADELLSQVFESALRQAGRYEDRGHSVSAWLYTIAHSRLIDHIRRTRRRGPAVPIEECVLGHDGGIETAEGRIDALPLLGLLSTLRPKQHLVLRLRLVEGRTLAETATLMGECVSTVKALQHRAILKLRQHAENPPQIADPPALTLPTLRYDP